METFKIFISILPPVMCIAAMYIQQSLIKKLLIQNKVLTSEILNLHERLLMEQLKSNPFQERAPTYY